MSNSSCRFKSGPRYQRQLQVIIVRFWAIFSCKENSPQRKALPRLYSLPGELFPFFCGLYSPLFPFVFAFSKNASPEQAPPSAPISAVGSISAPSAKEVKAPTTAPTRAGAMMITITVIIMMSTIQIFFMTLPFKRYLHS